MAVRAVVVGCMLSGYLQKEYNTYYHTCATTYLPDCHVESKTEVIHTCSFTTSIYCTYLALIIRNWFRTDLCVFSGLAEVVLYF